MVNVAIRVSLSNFGESPIGGGDDSVALCLIWITLITVWEKG